MCLLRRRLALLGVVLTVALGGAAVSGCGAVGHAVGGIVAHHLINRFVHTPAGLRRVDKLFCLYHGHRILVDLRHHSVLGASINFYEAFHSCRAGFGHG
jgi:hypothetical protein